MCKYWKSLILDKKLPHDRGTLYNKKVKMSRQINYLVIELDTKTHRLSVRNFLHRLDIQRRRKRERRRKRRNKTRRR